MNHFPTKKNFNLLEKFIEEAPLEINFTKDLSGFTLENGVIDLQYYPHTIKGNNSITLQLISKPTFIIEGYINPKKEIQYFANELYVLDSNPKKDNGFIIAHSTTNPLMEESHELEIPPQEIWFQNGASLIEQAAKKYNFEKHLENWADKRFNYSTKEKIKHYIFGEPTNPGKYKINKYLRNLE